MPEALLKREEVQRRTSLGRSKLFDLVAKGDFPKPVRLSPGRVAWVQSEIDAWILQRADERSDNPTGVLE